MLLIQLFAFLAVTFAIQPVEVRGNALFVKGSNERFYIRGLDYQPGGSSKLEDPLAEPEICNRDIKYFKELGINTIRIYSIDNTADHDECMNNLADAGIYVIFDTNIPHSSISRGDQAECSYNTMYLNEVFASVLNVAKYNNTLGFFAGNEVINDDASTGAALYVKAVVRDMKHFIKNRGLRKIPVGYSAADVEENRLQTAHYFNCGDDEMARVDWFGFNDYSWCGTSSFTRSGYDKKVEAYSNYSIPLFLSEYGCNKVTPRPFTEVESIYSTDMSGVFSGGLVYEYTMESNKYGLVQISSDNSSVTTNEDFDNLKDMFSKTPNPSGDGEYHKDLDFSECPPVDSRWNATNDLPDTPKGALKYLIAEAEPSGNGFDASTQWACVAKGNDVDDSDDHGSVVSTSSRTSSSSGSSGSDDSENNSSSRSRGDAATTHAGGLFTLAAFVIGGFLI